MKSELVSKEFQEDSIDMMKSFIKTLEESGSTSPPAADVLEQWLQHIE